MECRTEPSRELLEQALRESKCALDLDTALQNPTLRILLTNHAEALASKAHRSLKRLSRMAGTADWRARAAGDNND